MSRVYYDNIRLSLGISVIHKVVGGWVEKLVDAEVVGVDVMQRELDLEES